MREKTTRSSRVKGELKPTAVLEGQSDWGWKVAAYLFLAGMGAGAYAIGALSEAMGWSESAKIGVLLGFPMVAVGSLFLIADLGVAPRAWRVFLNPGTSWISKGTFIISAFMILGAIHLGLWIFPFQWLETHETLRLVLSAVNALFAVLTMIYTAILLGESKSIATWSTPILPVLFLVSGLSTGTMAILFVLSLLNPHAPGYHILLVWDLVLIVLELIVIAFYLKATQRTTDSQASAQLMTEGKYSVPFWGGVVLLGLLIPLLVELLEVYLPESASMASVYALFASLPGLIGGYTLRFVILACGVKAPLRAGGIEYATPRMAKTKKRSMVVGFRFGPL